LENNKIVRGVKKEEKEKYCNFLTIVSNLLEFRFIKRKTTHTSALQISP